MGAVIGEGAFGQVCIGRFANKVIATLSLACSAQWQLGDSMLLVCICQCLRNYLFILDPPTWVDTFPDGAQRLAILPFASHLPMTFKCITGFASCGSQEHGSSAPTDASEGRAHERR